MTPEVSIMGTTLHTTTIHTLPPLRSNTPARRASAAYPRVPAVMLWLASAITLAVVANRWIDLESGTHLMLVWLLLWAVVGSSFLLLAGTVQRMARRGQAGWTHWARQRAEAADWARAMRDRRTSADLLALHTHMSSQSAMSGAQKDSHGTRSGSMPLSTAPLRRSLTVQP